MIPIIEKLVPKSTRYGVIVGMYEYKENQYKKVHMMNTVIRGFAALLRIQFAVISPIW